MLLRSFTGHYLLVCTCGSRNRRLLYRVLGDGKFEDPEPDGSPAFKDRLSRAKRSRNWPHRYWQAVTIEEHK